MRTEQYWKKRKKQIEEWKKEDIPLSDEIWKDIKNYDGIYQISNKGRVKRIDKFSKKLEHGCFLKPNITDKGYLSVKLIKNTFFVHKLICEAFLGERPVGLQINHKDCDKKNNSVENLEYVTQTQNMQHAKKNGLRPDMFGKNNPFYGKKHSLETIEKLRYSHINISNETRHKMSESAKIRCIREGLTKVELMWNAKKCK